MIISKQIDQQSSPISQFTSKVIRLPLDCGHFLAPIKKNVSNQEDTDLYIIKLFSVFKIRLFTLSLLLLITDLNSLLKIFYNLFMIDRSEKSIVFLW